MNHHAFYNKIINELINFSISTIIKRAIQNGPYANVILTLQPRQLHPMLFHIKLLALFLDQYDHLIICP